IMADSTTVEPTERSMPPDAMTAVMPKAMMPTKAKFLDTLKRFLSVAKVSVRIVRVRQARTAARKTQKVWWLITRETGVLFWEVPITSARVLCEDIRTSLES